MTQAQIENHILCDFQEIELLSQVLHITHCLRMATGDPLWGGWGLPHLTIWCSFQYAL